jgi:hypothetical protein
MRAVTLVAVVVVVVVIIGAWSYVRCGARESTAAPPAESAAGTPQPGKPGAVPPAVETGREAPGDERPEHYYVELRHRALHRSRVELGLPKPSEATRPWGVIMETTYEEASVTVFAVSDGNASIYLSTGGGYIGGVSHEAVRRAAVNMVRVAGTLASLLSPAETYPLPDRGRTIFYVRTEAGVLTGGATEAELGQRRHPLSELFFAGQDVITQFRLVNEKK